MGGERREDERNTILIPHPSPTPLLTEMVAARWIWASKPRLLYEDLSLGYILRYLLGGLTIGVCGDW